jgi:MYXO-CTERM domain-containing protein
MQRVLLSSALASVGIALVACGVDQVSVHGDDPIASVSEPLSLDYLTGASLPPKTLVFTFDDGPGEKTGDISTYLKSEGIRAVFFVNGKAGGPTKDPWPSAPASGDAILAKVAADGHLVANHSATHRDLTTEVPANQLIQELAVVDNDIAPYTQPNLLFFRPRYGSWSSAVHSALKNSPMNKYVGPIGWDIGGTSDNYPNAAADWACWQGALDRKGSATPLQCSNAYIKEIDRVGKGIVLMHDAIFIKNNPKNGGTLEMLKDMVPDLKKKSYTFVRLDEVPDVAIALRCRDCDDGDECTIDSCDAARGCVHVADPVCMAERNANTDLGNEEAVDTDPPETGADNASTVVIGTIDYLDGFTANSGGSCNVGRAHGGQGAVALGALAWFFGRRRRRPASH